MSKTTAIGWVQNADGARGKTWNPTLGCDKVSAGCDNCYALDQAAKNKATGAPRYQTDGDPRTSGPGFGLSLQEDRIDQPRAWGEPSTIFVNSMSDLFHAKVPLEFLKRVFATIEATPQHTYQILTKRALRVSRLADQLVWPENLWMGVSVENAEAAPRIDHLRNVPAAVRFLSCEPLIGSVGEIDLSGIGWVIAGGESGPNFRPLNLDWARELRDQCLSAQVPYFFKQVGGLRPKSGGNDLDGMKWEQFPTALKPAASAV